MPPPKSEGQKQAARLARGELKGLDATGIPAFRPTPEQRHMVMVFTANGAKRAIIAEALQINVKTLDKYFYHEMQRGLEHVTMRIGSVVVREALAGNMAAARYWLTTHGGMGWRVPARDRDDEAGYNDNPRRPSEQAIQFYLPQNGRDQPEQVIIDVQADDVEKAA